MHFFVVSYDFTSAKMGLISFIAVFMITFSSVNCADNPKAHILTQKVLGDLLENPRSLFRPPSAETNADLAISNILQRMRVRVQNGQMQSEFQLFSENDFYMVCSSDNGIGIKIEIFNPEDSTNTEKTNAKESASIPSFCKLLTEDQFNNLSKTDNETQLEEVIRCLKTNNFASNSRPRDKLQNFRLCLMPIMQSNIDKYPELFDSQNQSMIKRQTQRPSISNTNIFPAFRRILERKRNSTTSRNGIDSGKQSDPEAVTEETQKESKKGDLGELEQTRQKRETHVLMTRYRSKKKITKRESHRRKKPKPNRRTSRYDDKDDDNVNCDDFGDGDKVSTTPYTFLNVSFTGYWERPQEKTTVEPRVKNPLKPSDKDMEFVYQTTKKPKGTRTKFKAVLGGETSKFRFSVKSDS